MGLIRSSGAIAPVQQWQEGEKQLFRKQVKLNEKQQQQQSTYLGQSEKKRKQKETINSGVTS